MSPWAYVLLVSLALNALLGWDDLRQRAAVATVAAERDAAAGAATACSDATEQLRILADKSLKDGAAARGKARTLAEQLAARADGELGRAPAVPGDVCASAAQENREWLTKRRAGK